MGGRTMRVGAGIGALLLWAAVAGSALAADGDVVMAGFAFGPQEVTIKAGDSVTWTNNDGATHTATGDGFDTGNVAGGGGTATVTFKTAGTFSYVCQVHPSMTGTVVVQAAGGGSDSGSGSNPTTPPTDTATVVPGQTPATPGGLIVAVLGMAAAIGLAASWRRLAEARARRR